MIGVYEIEDGMGLDGMRDEIFEVKVHAKKVDA